uniref:AAA+ ATPase domain-containing protein n=1 Tax=Oryza punctata TaxID=4537 RepID=A0A0E0MI38_ORYPU
MATILDSLIGSCVNKLQGIITEETILILDVEEELRKLQNRMKQIQCFISDAERRGMEDSAVHNWVSWLKDAMYDADDIIDLASFEGSKLLKGHSSSPRKTTACSGLSLLSCFSNIRVRHEIGDKIRSLNRKLEEIAKDKIFATLENTQSSHKVSTSELRKSCQIVEPNLVGKEILHASRKLVRQVLTHKKKKAYKLAIVGTGGIGKTTLAQKVFNDQKLKGSFDKHAWICVSQDYSPASVLGQLLRTIEVEHRQEESIGELQSKLESAIKDKSFFLVLDDLWQSDVWTNLLRIPLHSAATGIILITTRQDTVAREIGVEEAHRIDLMSPAVGWELLWKSMNIQDEKKVQNLRDVGIEIVQKCGGLPLAIKVIARVLASKDKTENEWKKILAKNVWSMAKLPKEIRGALYLSYDDLPEHLKQCFLYCIVYPEDWTIRRDELIRMWVAEGFVEVHTDQLLEDTAEEYYYELISRNLLQPVGSYFDQSRCKMHDLLRQLACYLSREECYIGDPTSLVDNNMCKLRRILVITEKDMVVIPSMGKEEIKLRTFRTQQNPLGIENTFFMRFMYLRVLDLSDLLVEKIPDCIGHLIHLRLLDLDGTSISCLPESIGALKNLQMLHLQRCESLHSLPTAITQLYNLRRLGLNETPINQVPKGVGRLKFLNDLEGFPIGGGSDNTKMQDGWNLEELAHLPHSTDPFLLAEKKHLKVLKLQCTEQTDEPYSEENARNVEKIFEKLTPPHNLEDLAIRNFFGCIFPTWLGTSRLSSLTYLNLIDCNSCMHLPPTGQLLNLKYLRIDGASAINKIGPEFVGCWEGNLRPTEVVVFPNLEEEWSFVEEEEEEEVQEQEAAAAAASKQKGEEAMSPRSSWLLPCLTKLALVDCPKLRGLPPQLGQQATNLKELQIRGSRCLKTVEDLPFLSGSLLVEGCEGLERVSNLPQVRELFVNRCPNLRHVEELGGLEQLWLHEGMQEISSLWVPGLQEKHRQLHGDEHELEEYRRWIYPSKDLSLIRRARCLKTVEDLRFLSSYLSIGQCEGLERVSNLPQIRELFVGCCPNLRHVEELGSLEQLWLYKDMQEISSLNNTASAMETSWRSTSGLAHPIRWHKVVNLEALGNAATFLSMYHLYLVGRFLSVEFNITPQIFNPLLDSEIGIENRVFI